MLLLFVSSPADGTWQLYAAEMLRGKGLYSDLNLNLQPVFPLFVMVSTLVSGGSFFVEKLTYLPTLLAYVTFIYKLCGLAQANRLQTSILTVAVFFTATHFTGYRFDDYHALVHVGVMASAYFSARYLMGEVPFIRFVALQSLLTILVLLTKPNEGLVLLGSVPLVVLSRERGLRTLLLAAALSLAIAAVIFVLIIAAIGETPAAWLDRTILDAPSAKGGGALLGYPLQLYQKAAGFLVPNLLVAVLATASVLLFSWSLYSRRNNAVWLILAFGFATVILGLLYGPDLLIPLVPLSLFAATAIGSFVLFRTIRFQTGKTVASPDLLPLFHYPWLLYLTGSLSSGGNFFGLFFPIALVLLLIPAIRVRGQPLFQQYRAAAPGFYAFCFVIGLQALGYRYLQPYAWLSYSAEPAFSNHRLVTDDRHGPHIISRRLLSLVEPVCAQVGAEDSLLSLPYSFANHYCGRQPWHGFVQTFYDTSTRPTIERLQGELRDAPPDYIFYQRQPIYLREHEVFFHRGERLPHRDLDEMIMGNIERGRWEVVYRSELYQPSTWLLIRTRRPKERFPAVQR